MSSGTNIPEEAVNRFFRSVEGRAWTDAEKELETVRQKAQDTAWYKGYVKGLEGLLLTFRNDTDKYIYLPKALADRSEQSTNQLRKQFSEFATSQVHGDYDRGYFKALEDYMTILASMKKPSPVIGNPGSSNLKDEATTTKKDEGLTPYLAESS